jgi:hypothetical protein
VTGIVTAVPAGPSAEVAAQQAARPKRRHPPADFGPVQVLRHVGLGGWQWEAGTAAGLIPEADVNGCRWSRAVADDVASRREEIVAAVGTDAPVGGHRAAARCAARTGLDVQKPDIEALAEAGLLSIAGWYKDWPLRDCRELDDRGAGGHGRGGTAGMDSGQRQQAGRPGVPGLAAERVHPGSRPSGSNGAGTYAKPLSARPRSCRRFPAARSAGAVSSQRWGLASNLIAFLASS